MVRLIQQAGELSEIISKSSIAANKQDLLANNLMNWEDSRTIDKLRKILSAELKELEIPADSNWVYFEDI